MNYRSVMTVTFMNGSFIGFILLLLGETLGYFHSWRDYVYFMEVRACFEQEVEHRVCMDVGKPQRWLWKTTVTQL